MEEGKKIKEKKENKTKTKNKTGHQSQRPQERPQLNAPLFLMKNEKKAENEKTRKEKRFGLVWFGLGAFLQVTSMLVALSQLGLTYNELGRLSSLVRKKPYVICQEIAWWDLRDALLRVTTRAAFTDVLNKLALLDHVDVEDVQWFVTFCNDNRGRDVRTAKELRSLLLSEARDANALCFAGLLNGGVECFREAAELGSSGGMAQMARLTSGEERFQYASRAAASGERDGFLWLGESHHVGDGGFGRNLAKARFCFQTGLVFVGSFFFPWHSQAFCSCSSRISSWNASIWLALRQERWTAVSVAGKSSRARIRVVQLCV